jgi:hypothetical protein
MEKSLTEMNQTESQHVKKAIALGALEVSWDMIQAESESVGVHCD